jgi:hypothetical protein
MGQKVAGTVYIKADGVQFTVTGGVEVPLWPCIGRHRSPEQK